MARLQVALDLIDLKAALDIATKVCELSPSVIVEAGTPLIKSVGMKAVKALREACSINEVVADTKTVDAGAIEARLAFEAGANYVTVLALAGDETISEVIDTARELGGQVIVDLINVQQPVAAAKKAAQLGADVVCFHVGIDVQRRRGITVETLLGEIREIKNAGLGIRLATAGGITPQTAEVLARAGVDIVIVGGYITKSQDPLAAARRILKTIEVRE